MHCSNMFDLFLWTFCLFLFYIFKHDTDKISTRHMLPDCKKHNQQKSQMWKNSNRGKFTDNMQKTKIVI